MKYILKTKGTAKIPNYLQIRDENFQLIKHCTINKSINILKELGIEVDQEKTLTFIENMPFGELTAIGDK